MNEKWGLIYREHAPTILKSLTAKCYGNTNDAEDLLHDLFERLMKKYPEDIDVIQNIGGLLQKSSHLLFIDAYRKSIASMNPMANVGEFDDLRHSDGSNLEAEVTAIIQRKELATAIGRLPKEFNEVMELLVQGLEYHEIAEVLKLDMGTVKSRVSRAKQRLLKEDRLFK